MRDAVIVLAVLCLIGCRSGAGGSPDGAPGAEGRAPIAPFETYVRNPTEIRAGEVRAIFPATYAEDLEVHGLSDGWREDGGSRTWEGSGDCSLSLHHLKIECRALSVSLVEDQDDPEVMIQAAGDVYIGHGVRSVATFSEHLDFLLLRNDRRLER